MKPICLRCGKVHNNPPVNIDKIIEEKGNEIARDIDRQVLEKLLFSHGGRDTNKSGLSALMSGRDGI